MCCGGARRHDVDPTLHAGAVSTPVLALNFVTIVVFVCSMVALRVMKRHHRKLRLTSKYRRQTLHNVGKQAMAASGKTGRMGGAEQQQPSTPTQAFQPKSPTAAARWLRAVDSSRRSVRDRKPARATWRYAIRELIRSQIFDEADDVEPGATSARGLHVNTGAEASIRPPAPAVSGLLHVARAPEPVPAAAPIAVEDIDAQLTGDAGAAGNPQPPCETLQVPGAGAAPASGSNAAGPRRAVASSNPNARAGTGTRPGSGAASGMSAGATFATIPRSAARRGGRHGTRAATARQAAARAKARARRRPSVPQPFR